MVRILPLLLLLLGGCAGEEPSPPAAPRAAAPDREAWWAAATQHPSGRERVLAPRELRALLAEGRSLGFDGDSWWAERRKFADERILEVDPDDLEANEGMGRRTLQSIEGFEPLWQRMLLTRAPNEAITALLDQYDVWVQEARPIFLTADEYEVVTARLAAARAHLDRLESDRQYAALQTGLARIGGSVLADYPAVHVVVGPFVVFYSARDLQRGVEQDEASEEQRLAARRELYRRKLEERRAVYEELLVDLKTLYPRLWQRYGVGEGDLFYQFVFDDRGWYLDFVNRIGKPDREPPYRSGFFEPATGWAYLYRPAAPSDGSAEASPVENAEAQLRETAAYLAAQQLLRHWAKDAADPTTNHMDRCRAYWLEEGWPSFLAARRVERPLVGPLLREAVRFQRSFPPLRRVLERESRLELARYQEPAAEFEEGEDIIPPVGVRRAFTDLAWLLVRHLNDDEHREAFERFLLSQVEGTRHGREWFEECFGVEGTEGMRRLEKAVYAPFVK